MQRLLLSCIVVAVALTQTALAQVEAVTRFREERRLSFDIDGKVGRVPVKKGDTVAKLQELILLEDEEGKALIELWSQRSTDEVAIDVRKARLKLARTEESRITDLVKKGSAGPIEEERAQSDTRVKELEVEEARIAQAEAGLQLKQAEARHSRYVMSAPIAGVVDRVLVSEGESVQSLQPVLLMVATDAFEIEAPVPTAEARHLKEGDPAWVRLKTPGDDPPVQGRITHVALVADPASNTRTVAIEVPNEHNQPAGQHVVVTFEPPGAVADATDAAVSTSSITMEDSR